MARPELDRGPLEADKLISNLSVVFKLTPAQIAERDALIEAQQDPGSASYHKWLTPETYAARFGASPDVVARTIAWLSQQGLTVHEASRLGSRVTFSGKVSDLQTAFKAPMRKYEVAGKLHYAMAAAPSLPADLADAVLAIRNTHDFYPQPMARMGSARTPEYKNGFQVGFSPPDWANVYDVTKLYTQGVSGTPITGAGVTIGIVGVAQVGQNDLDAFKTKFGLPLNPITMTLVPNTGPAAPGASSAQPGAGVEAYLDTEWSGGVAPGATVNYVFTGANDGNADDATYYIIENNLTPIISESFGGCELGITAAEADVVGIYGSAAELLGITYLAASGDSGAAGCTDYGVSGLYAGIPDGYPGVTAVGGSEFPAQSITYDAGVAVGYSTQEECWNEGNTQPNIGAGGGGISVVFARPSYQLGVPTCTMLGTLPQPVNPGSMRMTPDVAVNAASNSNPDFIVCDIAGGDCGVTSGSNDSVYAVGGTSASAPAFAGVVALIEQATGGGRLGNINPMLYQLAASAPSSFHDLVNGNNEIHCTAGTDTGCPAGGLYGFPATTGYDCATGLGSIDGFNLASAWASLAATTVSLNAMPTSTTPGSPVSLTATVAVPAPNASDVAGTVRYTFQSYSPDGTPDLSWTLGSAAITGGMTSGGSAVFTGPIPPGLVNPAAQYVDVVAMYGGDAHHLASTSAKVRLTFSQADFCLVPSIGTILPTEGFTFSYTGGTPPVLWFTGADSTCDANFSCSTLNQSTGAFMAGPEPGYVVVVGIDSTGMEQVAYLTVGDPGPDAGAPPWGDAGVPLGGCMALPPDAGFTIGPQDAGSGTSTPDDGGSTVIVDSGTTPEQDGSVSTMDASADSSTVAPGEDAGEAGPAGDGGSKTSPAGSSGCGCKVGSSGPGAPSGALAGLGLGLLLRRRRRSR